MKLAKFHSWCIFSWSWQNFINFASFREVGKIKKNWYRVIHPNWQKVLSYNSVNKWLYKKVKISHCSKFIDVYLLARKILKSATIGTPAHFAFQVEICHKTSNNFCKNRKIWTFCIIAYPRSIKTSKSIWPLESSWNLLQNLSNRDFLAQFVQTLCRNEHSWSKWGTEN